MLELKFPIDFYFDNNLPFNGLKPYFKIAKFNWPFSKDNNNKIYYLLGTDVNATNCLYKTLIKMYEITHDNECLNRNLFITHGNCKRV